MPLGIRPINDFAFKKTFGSPENRECLISLLNAVLKPKSPVVDVTIKNPFNRKDFEDDKLSVVDVKAVDSAGATYHVEVQLRAPMSLPQRAVFYGCELYADQLREGIGYADLCPVDSIWLINNVLWPDTTQFHHAFRLTDAAAGRVLNGTLEIHTIELPKYNTKELELPAGELLGWWLYWFRHAQDYEAERLLETFPQPAIRQATQTLVRIAEITEDKIMYDVREKAIRDRKWEIDSAKREAMREGEIKGEIKGMIEGEIKGEIKGKTQGKIETIRMLEGLLYQPLSDEKDLATMGLEQLEALMGRLQEKLRSRTAPSARDRSSTATTFSAPSVAPI